MIDKILFRFAICRCIPEIFATKFESCQKSRRIIDDFFAVPNFRGRAFQKSPSKISRGRPSKSYTHFITAASRHVAWKKFYEETPTSPEVIGAHTVNFKPNFKFSRLNFFGQPVPVGVCASKMWSISRACKNLRSKHPLRAEM